MASCTENKVTTFTGDRATLYVCPSVSGDYVNVTLKNKPTENVQIKGYVRFVLEEDNGKEAWQRIATNSPGLWEDSRKTSFDGRLYRKAPRSLVRVVVEIFADATYKTLLSVASSDAFYRG